MIINNEQLSKIRERYKDKKIVFCSGSFDLTHVGHILFLEDCKKQGDILVVGVGNDRMLMHHKGNNRPILNEQIRLKTIDSLKSVDYTLIDGFSSSENPLFLLDKVFEILKPDVYVINEDAFNIPYREETCKKFNVKMVILKRTCPEEFENISTSKIIQKIKNL
jgi:cytidyltransferase-like protein